MLIIKEGTRFEPTKAICDKCGKEVQLVLHHDYLEGFCCDKSYYIKNDGSGFWNCCSVGENTKE